MRGDRTLRVGRFLERDPGDVGTRARECDRDRLPDPARRPGDDGAAAREIEGGWLRQFALVAGGRLPSHVTTPLAPARRLARVRLGVAAAVIDGALVRGDVEIGDGELVAAGLGAGAGTGIAVPGLVDLQVNGYHGVDVASADAHDLVELGHALARDGVLAYQPTIVTGPLDETRRALGEIAAASDRGGTGAVVVGAHLEGPFLSPRYPGAHPREHLREPDLDVMASLLLAGCPVSTVTVAPELPRGQELVEVLSQRGIVVSLGHTDGTAAEAHAAFDHGARAVTHLFNAMRPFRHRDPGVAGTALAREDITVMLVADGVHVAHEALLLCWRAAGGRLVLVSDAVMGTGLGDGSYRVGRTEVRVERGVSRLADGTLAGATRPLAWGLRLLVELGVPIVEAVATVTRTPALLAGRTDLGVLTRHGPADLVVLGDDFAVERVLRRGVDLR